MGFWYLLALALGILLYVKFTFFSKEYHWRLALSLQLAAVGLALAAFALFMLSPLSGRLVDLLFS